MAGKIPYRFWIGTLIFYSTFINYAMRVNLSVSILAMRRSTGNKSAEISICEKHEMEAAAAATAASMTTKIPISNTTIAMAEKYEEEGFFKKVEFSETVNGQLLSAYGYGYIISSIPGGFFAEYFGSFRTLFYSNLIAALLTALCVPAAYLHWSVVFLMRLLIGITGGVCYPALQILVSKWAPANEKGKFLSGLMGNTLGTAVIFPLVGYVSDVIDWASGFFLVAALAVVYVVVIYIFLSDSPDKCRFISPEEKEFLAEAVPPPKMKLVAPYKKIFGSYRFWALAALHFANLYGLFIILLSIPQFFRKYLGFNLKKSGVLSALPPLLRLFTGLLFGVIGDAITKKQPCGKTAIRKSFLVFSHILPGCCLLAIVFCGCYYIPATIFLMLTQGFNAAVILTNLHNPQDLAPNFAGTIFGIISVIGGVSQFIVPTITAALTEHGNTMKEWQYVFYLGAGIYFMGSIIFLIFGTANRQPWNEPQQKEPPQAVPT